MHQLITAEDTNRLLDALDAGAGDLKLVFNDGRSIKVHSQKCRSVSCPWAYLVLHVHLCVAYVHTLQYYLSLCPISGTFNYLQYCIHLDISSIYLLGVHCGRSPLVIR